MKLIFTVLAGLVLGLGFGQDCAYTLSGKITDFHDGSPIVNATIYAENLDSYTTTDIDGNYKLENLCSGIISLKVTHIACEDLNIDIYVGGNTIRNLTMEHHIEELDEVSVKGKIAPEETKTAQEAVLNQQDINDFSSAALGDLLREVQGVSSINTGNTIVKPMINGLHSSRIIIMSNRVRLQDQDWGIEHAPNIDLNAAGSVSVIKGAGTLAYGGDAIGGIVVLNPKRSFYKDSLFGQTILNGQSNGRGASLSTSLSRTFETGWYAHGQASYKRFGDFESPDYVLTNTGLDNRAFALNFGKRSFETGFEAYYSYVRSEIGILASSHIGNIEDLVNSINSLQPLIVEDFSYDINAPRQEVTHHLAKLQYFKRFKSFGRLDIQYDYQNNQRFEYDRRVGEDRDTPAVDLKLQTHTLSADLRLDTSLKRSFQVGALFRFQDNFANPDTGVRRLIPDYNKYEIGVYGIMENRFSDKLLGEFGARYDYQRIDAKKFYQTSRWEERGYDEDFADIIIQDLGTQLLTNPVFDFHNVSVSAGLKYEWSDHTLSFNAGLSNRAPNPSELFSDGLHHSAARIELGDLRIDPETSFRTGLSFMVDKETIRFGLDTYINSISDFIQLEPTGVEQTIRGAFPVWEYNQTNALMWGVDLSLNYDINKNLNLNHKSSYIYAQDQERNRPIIDIPAFNTTNSLAFIKPEWNDFRFELESEWVFEQTRFPNNNFDAYLAATDTTVEVDISTPPSAYHLLNTSAGMHFNWGKRTQLAVNVMVNNLLDTNYRNYLNRLRYFADDLGRNISLQLQLNY